MHNTATISINNGTVRKCHFQRMRSLQRRLDHVSGRSSKTMITQALVWCTWTAWVFLNLINGIHIQDWAVTHGYGNTYMALLPNLGKWQDKLITISSNTIPPGAVQSFFSGDVCVGVSGDYCLPHYSLDYGRSVDPWGAKAAGYHEDEMGHIEVAPLSPLGRQARDRVEDSVRRETHGGIKTYRCSESTVASMKKTIREVLLGRTQK